MERAIETQRLRLLRIVAGLVAAVGVLSVGPVSRGFSVWACGFVGSILSRAEAAARYLVIAQARQIAARNGFDGDYSRFSVAFIPAFPACETDVSLCDIRQRLRAVQAVLMDVPRHALRLLRRIEKRMRRAAGADRPVPRPDAGLSASLRDWRLAENRIERPPDQIERQVDQACPRCRALHLPPVSGREAQTVGHPPDRF